ncbi:hypothetical protein D0C36_20035 [Mucilaginibacter conchicola]|uniref:ApeA N-terminal domain-containing protein n=1 Tax=Mucilaginibacter conchicola TaxID=2303333 RepID=A0A372NQV6_9SPHI|nr:hypothetical protein [Mucilaginibacter conchicola]RFZ91228.1 hypothetical protein D0C36_20035 [Mucilaginibacter conchicola]
MSNPNLILKLIGSVLEETLPGEEYLTLAELRSVTHEDSIKTIDTNTALISPGLFKKIKASHTNPFVNSTGASYHEDWAYTPDFWLYLSPAPGLKKAETLVVSWTSGNQTTLLPDQGLVKTFDLIPRFAGDETLWHDLAKPLYNVIINKPVSNYDFPSHTESYVKILPEYLEIYLKLRKKSAVQIFTIKTDLPLDSTTAELLNGKDHYKGETGHFEIRLRRSFNQDKRIHIEINGYRLLLPPQKDEDAIPKEIGHYWQGIGGLVDSWRARHEMPGEFAYVSDEVLDRYEQDDDYEVHPESGSVSYLNQWSISHCERIGRNGIKVEIKKLYEGTPYGEIDYWNKFSIDPSAIRPGENIEEKSRRLIRRFFLFGRILAKLINRACNFDYTAAHIITLDEDSIDHRGWAEFLDYEQISRHIPARGFSKDQFLTRCKSLYQLLGENLQEARIRKAITCLEFPDSAINGFRSLKLLEMLIRYFSIARNSGLDITKDNLEIVKRTLEKNDNFPLADLSALVNIRNLGSHKGGDIKTKLQTPLKALGIAPNAISNNYAYVCDAVYDRLADMFTELNEWLVDL